MVWAAEFVRAMGPYRPDARHQVQSAIRRAAELVEALRREDEVHLESSEVDNLNADARVLLGDMLGRPK